MIKSSWKTLLAVLGLAMLTTPACADVDWAVNGHFTDGTAITGTFTVDIYGFVDAVNITTLPGSGLTGFHYTLGTSGATTQRHALILAPDAQDILVLDFNADITGPVASDPLLTSSFECQGSYSCYLGTPPLTRFLAGGSTSAPSAAVPELQTWAGLAIGLGMVGATVRRRRRAEVVA